MGSHWHQFREYVRTGDRGVSRIHRKGLDQWGTCVGPGEGR